LIASLELPICHTGSVRGSPESPRAIYAGMPSNMSILRHSSVLSLPVHPITFSTLHGSSLRWRDRAKYDLINRLLLRYYAIPLMRERLLMLKAISVRRWNRTLVPAALTRSPSEDALGISPGKLETRELVGLCDFAIDLATRPAQREDIHAHWDGNNNMMWSATKALRSDRRISSDHRSETDGAH